jgi:hypothetical protein
VRCRVSQKKRDGRPTHCRPPEPVVLCAVFPVRAPNVARDGDAAMHPRLIPNKGPEPVDVHVPGFGDEVAMSVEAVRSPPPITRASSRLYSHQLLKRLSGSSGSPGKTDRKLRELAPHCRVAPNQSGSSRGNPVGMSPYHRPGGSTLWSRMSQTGQLLPCRASCSIGSSAPRDPMGVWLATCAFGE